MILFGHDTRHGLPVNKSGRTAFNTGALTVPGANTRSTKAIVVELRRGKLRVENLRSDLEFAAYLNGVFPPSPLLVPVRTKGLKARSSAIIECVERSCRPATT